jgi:hypothetical protein
MNLGRPVTSGFLLLLWLPLRVHSQEIPWHDPSPHAVQFVDVDHGVKLEGSIGVVQGDRWFS